MTHDEAFLQAIREAPEDDTPRLVYADWLEEHGRSERAEFIRIQCALARKEQDQSRAKELRDRAERLLEAYWDEWLAPLRDVLRPEVPRVAGNLGHLFLPFRPGFLRHFRRGFVESLVLTSEWFTSHGGELSGLLPLADLGLMGADHHARTLAACPHLGGVSRLRFVDYYREPLTATGAPALAASPHLGRLRELFLASNNLGDAGLAALAAAPWARGLRLLIAADNGLTADAVSALCDAGLDGLAVLVLDHSQLGDRGLAALAGSPILRGVRTLSLLYCGIGDGSVAALADSPHAAGLEWLGLAHNAITDQGARALARSPHLARLEMLSLSGNPVSPGALESLARSPNLPRLSGLHPGTHPGGRR
jgi:uncharacterized protein (TIGR02996 family)